ncbi:hypothetical protein L2223_21290, partial [Xanthomonas perforans]|nr:hypothetical protein [Xanthomonas perforans]
MPDRLDAALMPPKKTLLQAVMVNEPSNRRAGRNQWEAREGMGNIGTGAGRVVGTRHERNRRASADQRVASRQRSPLSGSHLIGSRRPLAAIARRKHVQEEP